MLQQDTVADTVVLPYIVFERDDGHDNGVAEVEVVAPRQMYYEHILQVGQHLLDRQRGKPVDIVDRRARGYGGEEIVIVAAYGSENLFLDCVEEAAHKRQVAVVARRMKQGVEMALDIRYLESRVVILCLDEIVGNGRQLDALQCLLGKVVVVGIGVDYRHQKVGVESVVAAYFAESQVAYTEGYTESVQYRNYTGLLEHYFAESCGCVVVGHC